MSNNNTSNNNWNNFLTDLDDNKFTFQQAVNNLDSFFIKVYKYYAEKGYYSIILSRIINMITLAFTIIFSSFLVLCVDWTELAKCTKDDYICDHIIGLKSSTIESPNFLQLIIIISFIVFTLYWLWNLYSFFLYFT